MLRRTPAEVSAIPAPGERVLAWAMADAAYVVATDQALYLPVPGIVRLPWDLIQRAVWEEFVLVVEGRSEVGERLRTWRAPLAEPRSVPEVAHERIRSSIVVSEHVDLEGEAGARITARRAGEGLRWTVTFDPGLDPQDPDLRRRADAALADLRQTFGV